VQVKPWARTLFVVEWCEWCLSPFPAAQRQKNPAPTQTIAAPVQIISSGLKKNTDSIHIFSPWKQIKTDGQHIITGEEQKSSGEEQEISPRRQIFADEEEKISARCGKFLS
jgi:hypothetical protein